MKMRNGLMPFVAFLTFIFVTYTPIGAMFILYAHACGGVN